MNTHDKKTELLELLSHTNDSTLIDELYDMFHPAAAIENIPLEELSGELQQKIEKALDDYRSGNYITHEAMKQKLAQWLTK